jgi:hypothetical protein
MDKYLGQPAEVSLQLTLAGVPVTGVLFSAVTVTVRPPLGTAFVPKVMTALNWMELGAGIYVLTFSPADMALPGEFVYGVAGGAFDFQWGSINVIPPPPAIIATPPVCVITGNVIDLEGRSFWDAQALTVTFRPVQMPQQSGNTSLITSRPIVTTTDAYGNFSVPLLQGSTVLVEVAALGLRQQFVVPALTTATLLSLLPPIPT